MSAKSTDKGVTLSELSALSAHIKSLTPWIDLPEVTLMISQVLPSDTAVLCFMGIDDKPCAVVAKVARDLFPMSDRELGKFLWWQAQKQREAK